ncbi:MAG: type 4a pilus biogenesis protein PilO [Candidatus Paceibacterota bacterium]|jgi:Tfp pilus assembly protein PilO
MPNGKLKNKVYSNILILLIIIGIFYFVIYPQYSGSGIFYSPEKNISTLLDQNQGYDKAISIANDYNKKIANNNRQYVDALNSLSIDTLNKVLPTSADPVLVIYELSEIAKQPGSSMILLSPKFTDNGGDKNSNKKYNTLSVSFTLEGTYNNMKSFLKNLENSNRIYNVTSLNFSSAQDTRATSALKYSVTVETYYLKQN